MTRIVIVGGAGVFGRRLAEGLATTPGVHLILAGRSRRRAAAAALALSADFAVLDRACAAADDVRKLSPDLVIDAAGPFQGAHLHFARVVIEAGAHYIDIADARDFVAALPTLDALARERGVCAITGASSTPSLTHAALDHLCVGWRRVDVVRAGIAPGNRAPRGLSLVEAILHWTGAPLRVLERGAWQVRRGWSHCCTLTIAGLGRRRFALAETPDLDLIATRFRVRDTAWFMAALELAPLHRGLELISAMRGLWRRPEGAAPLLQRAGDLLGWLGSDRGAMVVEALGRDAADTPLRARWTMIAPEGRGPYTPSFPALALAQQIASGSPPAPGAYPCVGVVTLEDIAPSFARHGFTTAVESARLRSAFEAALGADYRRLAPAVRAAHEAGPVTRLRGRAAIAGAETMLGRCAAFLFGMPLASADAPVRVTMRAEGDGVEVWEREFNGRRMRSRLRAVGPGRVRESFGPFAFELAVEARDGALLMRVAGWRAGILALPRFLAPRSDASERQDETGRFCFDVPIAAALIGRLTHYAGHLEVEEVETPASLALSAPT